MCAFGVSPVGASSVPGQTEILGSPASSQKSWRSTLELLRYLAGCGIGSARAMCEGNWDGYKEAMARFAGERSIVVRWFIEERGMRSARDARQSLQLAAHHAVELATIDADFGQQRGHNPFGFAQ